MKNISILGSTGSIGTQTLEIVRHNNDLRVTALCAGSNIHLLEQQILEFKPLIAAVYEEDKAKELKSKVSHLPVQVLSGMDGLIACATEKNASIIVAAIVGMIGIKPVIEAIREKKNIALANKETLVTAGHLIMPFAAEKKVSILPVDSEHSAIFQLLHGEKKEQIEKIILTASGGPFRGKKREDLKKIKAKDALKHPNWEMGKKITIDSSTMVNKGLEVMEARWLFDMEYDKIEVVVQPQSIIHSMIEWIDGAVTAQLGTPDMKLPIQYALFYPDRIPAAGQRIDFKTLSHLDFEAPDKEAFPGLSLAYQAGRAGGTMPAVYNASNELAVSKFLKNEISYLEIPEIIAYGMEHHKRIENPTLEEILLTEASTYELIEEWIRK